MSCMPLILAVVVSIFLTRDSNAAFAPADNYLLACGSSQNVTYISQTYVPDSLHSLQSKENSIAATANSSAPFSIYQFARIFHSMAFYTFDIKQEGHHWVRLYFYPLPGHNLTSASMTVVTENFVLLNNFSFKSYNGSYLFKEYVINVNSDSLILALIPSNNSVAFINAIEVVSVPDELIPDQAVALSPVAPFNGLSGLALETVYRLNMGGPHLTALNDTLGRTWENDVKYLYINSSATNVSISPSSIKYPATMTPEIAPHWVYATAETMGHANTANGNFNITWVFPVDPTFMYFIRVHFCDIVSASLNRLLFNLYVNDDTALLDLDLSNLAGNLDVPLYKDFVSNISLGNSSVLTVSVGPDKRAHWINAIMNGLEIMKISNDARSLSGVQPVETLLVLPHKKNKIGIILGFALGASAVLSLIVLGCCCFIARRSKTSNQGHSWMPSLYGNSLTLTKTTLSRKSGTASCISLASTNVGRFFSFQEIMDATNKFDESLLLGVGGFGRVYKGTMEDGTKLAVKRGNTGSEQGLAEFQTEIEMLSKLRHRHLVSLIGYCDERSEMILVYEYMGNGPLRSHLYGTDLPPLSWKQRLKICIGAARGCITSTQANFACSYTGAAQSIIHRDVKTTNILLDENFVAKVADFGLSKAVPALDQTHVSTAVKGSFGYLDPEYFRRQQLTEKSDVYSFGVVLMEVLCTRPALNPVLPCEQVNIAEWAMIWQKKGVLDQIMDPNLEGQVNPASLKKFGETAEKCLAEYGVDRPSMGNVLCNLEYALQLEEASSPLIEPGDNSTNHIPGIPLTPVEPFDNSVSNIQGIVNSGTDDEAGDAATSSVFSQLVNPRGR